MVVPFDWDAVPRGSGVGALRTWKGFRGLSGDLVRRVIQELHPYAQVEFRAKSDPWLGPPTRKIHHGYLVSFSHDHTAIVAVPSHCYCCCSFA